MDDDDPHLQREALMGRTRQNALSLLASIGGLNEDRVRLQSAAGRLKALSLQPRGDRAERAPQRGDRRRGPRVSSRAQP